MSYMQDVVGSIPTGTTEGTVAQMVEHLAEDQGVGGSIPPRSTNSQVGVMRDGSRVQSNGCLIRLERYSVRVRP